MDFSEALIAVKSGYRIKRLGWNGLDQYVVVKYGYKSIPANVAHSLAHNVKVGTIVSVSPYLEIKTTHGEIFPWTPSQGDLMAQDWELLGE